MPKNNMLIVKDVRCLYPALDEPKTFEGQTEAQAKYGIKFLIPKTDKAKVQQVKDFLTATIQSHPKWPVTVKKAILKIALDADPYQDNAVLKDGDALNQRRVDEGKEPVAAYEGNYVLGAKRNIKIGPPSVVDPRNKPIPAGLIKGEIQGGYWINIAVTGYMYDKPKQGITLSLDAVQKVREDEVFGRESVFEALENSEDIEDTGDIFTE